MQRINETSESGALKLLRCRKDKRFSDEEYVKILMRLHATLHLKPLLTAEHSRKSLWGNRNDLHRKHWMSCIWEWLLFLISKVSYISMKKLIWIHVCCSMIDVNRLVLGFDCIKHFLLSQNCMYTMVILRYSSIHELS